MRCPYRIALGLIALASLACGQAAEGTPPTTYKEPTPHQQRLACQEDEPCWDCETMGNKVCGVTAER